MTNVKKRTGLFYCLLFVCVISASITVAMVVFGLQSMMVENMVRAWLQLGAAFVGAVFTVVSGLMMTQLVK